MLKYIWNKAADQSTLKLEGEAVINNIVALTESLKTETAKIKTLRLDLSGLTACDLSFLQLLCALHQSILNKQGNLDFGKLPACFFELVTAIGLNTWSICEFKEKQTCLVGDWMQARKNKETLG